MKRSAGILYPIFSLSSRYGIGCFSKEAYEFIDFLKKAGQTYWQILPIHPTGFGDSPYQPVSAFAGNPYFISLEDLIQDGLLTEQECNSYDFGHDVEHINYGALYNYRQDLLKQAFVRFQPDDAYEKFLKDASYWLKDYALYMVIKQQQEGKSWNDWPLEARMRKPSYLKQIETENKKLMHFYYFQQYEFAKQWQKLLTYAHSQEIQIIGDIPFYCAMDSSDVWAHPEIFWMDEDYLPKYVAGTLPDAFSPTGQRWGNPVYDWTALKKTKYDWWMKRMQHAQKWFDVVRIDHFHGFSEYCAIPYEEETTENGIAKKGPGLDFFNVLKQVCPDIEIIAEDLGTNTPEKEKLLKDTGFPGMNVLQFAFTGWNHDSYYLTHNHKRNSVVYTGTHDNPTTLEWFETLNEGDRIFASKYIHTDPNNPGQFVWDFIREAYRSVANLTIVSLSDYLVKGKEVRINTPGTSQGNWQWRLVPHFLSDELAYSIRDLADIYGRLK